MTKFKSLLESADYKGEHESTGSEGAPAHDLTANGIYPDDVYSGNASRMYSTGRNDDSSTFSTIHSLRGKPNASIKIYRAVPHEKSNEEKIFELESHKKHILKTGKVPSYVNSKLSSNDYFTFAVNEIDKLKSLPEVSQEKKTINHGDWVTPNRAYAKEHGEENLGGKYKIISKTVRAKDIFTNGDSIHEFGYHPAIKEEIEESIDDILNELLIESGCGMLSLSDLERLDEALSIKNINKIDRMNNTMSRISDIHDGVFGKGNERIEIPFEKSEEPITTHNYSTKLPSRNVIPHHQHVITRLNLAGWHVTDYLTGKAIKKNSDDKREYSIGKILANSDSGNLVTGIMSKPTHKRIKKEDGTVELARDNRGQTIIDKPSRNLTISEAYAADPIRSASKKPLSIIISRNKYDVGGMSTAKGWKSCMDLDSGCYREKVKHDIEHGTLTAYVVKKGSGSEDPIDNPVGRVNIKKFNPSVSTSPIFRPESTGYGVVPKEAKEAISSWTEKHYPENHGEFYSKETSLYNDDGKSIHIKGSPKIDTQEDIKKLNDSVGKIARNIVHSNQAMDEEKDYGNGADLTQDAHDKFSNIWRKLPKESRDHLAAHHVIESASEHDGDEDAMREQHNTYIHELHGDDLIAAHAHEHKIDLSSFTAPQLEQHLHNIHHVLDTSSDIDRDDHYTALKDFHHSILSHIFAGNNTESKEKTIHHILDADDEKTDYYSHMSDEHGSFIPRGHESAHIIQHTQNPRLIERLLAHGRDHDNYINEDINANGLGFKRQIGYHIGKHTDHELASSFTDMHKIHTSSILNGFYSGLNDNKNGEAIQHHLISQLNLHGGETGLYGPIDPIQSKVDMQHVMRHGGPTVDSDYIPEKNDIYSDIASHTKFKSVKQALANRTDTKTPEIQNSLNRNLNIEEIYKQARELLAG